MFILFFVKNVEISLDFYMIYALYISKVIAGVVKLVDAPDSKSGDLRVVRVQVPPPAIKRP